MKSLPSDGASSSSRKRAKPREIKVSLVAHDLKSKPRTEDVTLSQEDTDKDFSSLMLSEPVLKGLKESGFVRPSPIQLAAIPNAKIGLDMIVQAKSGTGKTCVYVVTALEMLKRDLPGLQVLVLAPTREIAMQGLEVASQIGAHMPGIKIASFIGGLPLIEDKMKATNCQMAIGTPGRVKQLLTEKVLNADTIRLVILDEADKLLEQSFLTETTAILDMLPSSKQVMTLSATYPDNLAALAENLMRSPQHIRLAQANQSKGAAPAKSAAKPKASGGGDSSLGGDDPSWHLGKNKHVVVRQFKGQTYIDIREYYVDKNTMETKPGKKGISLNCEQYQKLKTIIDDIDHALP